jgi:hypothetical protein
LFHERFGFPFRFTLEEHAGGEIAHHPAAIIIEPVHDLVLSEGDRLPEFNFLDQLRRVVDLAGKSGCALLKGRNPEELGIVIL